VLLYEGVMSRKVGGDTTAEGKAASVRMQLDIERITSASGGEMWRDILALNFLTMRDEF
jgi:hypothetical protein